MMHPYLFNHQFSLSNWKQSNEGTTPLVKFQTYNTAFYTQIFTIYSITHGIKINVLLYYAHHSKAE